jgi:hypothetical protein
MIDKATGAHVQNGICPSWSVQRGVSTLGLAGLAILALGIAAAAQGNSTPPMPPPRPASLMAAPPPINLQVPALPPGIDPMVANFAPDEPVALPPASRAQMHKCGSEWQKMKASGAAADKTWLSFAKVCLVQ